MMRLGEHVACMIRNACNILVEEAEEKEVVEIRKTQRNIKSVS
jgi:hypothetical protein